MDTSALRALTRKALQKLAKKHGIKANLKSEEIIDLLIEKQAPRRSPSPEHDAPATHEVRQPSTTEGRPPRGYSKSSERGHIQDGPEDAAKSDRPSASSHIPEHQAQPSQPPSAPPTLAHRESLPSFRELVSTLQQPEPGPSRYPPQAHSLGIFTASSASRAPWPQGPFCPPQPPPGAYWHSGSGHNISHGPPFPQGTYSDSLSTGMHRGFSQTYTYPPVPQPVQYALPQFVEGSSASAAGVRAAAVPQHASAQHSYRTRPPTPLEEYDSMYGVPAFTEPGSDYVEEWTEYSAPRPNSAYLPPQENGDAQAAGAGPSPKFFLSQAVFNPPNGVAHVPPRSPVLRPPSRPISPRPVFHPAPSSRPRSPVFRPPAPPAPPAPAPVQPANAAGRDAAPAPAAPAPAPPAPIVAPNTQAAEEEELEELATEEEMYNIVTRIALVARRQCSLAPTLEEIHKEVKVLNQTIPAMRNVIRQERVMFHRIRTYLGHINVKVAPRWDEKDIWDKACETRNDETGNQLEIETDDDEEAEWRRKNPVPENAHPTEIVMKKWTPFVPGATESDANIVPLVAHALDKQFEERAAEEARAREEEAQRQARVRRQTPKRRRGEDDTGRAKKKYRATPAPRAFLAQKKGDETETETEDEAGGQEKDKNPPPPLDEIAEEDEDEEEDMEMTDVVGILNGR